MNAHVIPGPATVRRPADAVAIVAFIAHRILLGELDFHGLAELTTYHPALAGLTEDRIREIIAEALV